MRANPRRPGIWVAGLALSLAGLACSLTNATPVAWSRTATPLPVTPMTETAPQPTQAVLPRPTATLTRPPQETAPTPLPAAAPYLVYASSDRQTLLAWSAGRQQPAQITLPGPLDQPGDLARGASPTGAYLALRCRPGDGSGLSLLLVSLTDGAQTVISPLLSAELNTQSGGETPSEAVQAVEDEAALAWSPDGGALAFIAAVDGASADLYVYRLGDGSLRRLTHGSRQAATPTWSPDGQWILVQDVDSFGTGAGWKVGNVYAVSTGQDGVRTLYTPPAESGGEVFAGWTAPDTLLVYSWTPQGARLAREAPVSGRAEHPVYAGPFDQLAFDPDSRWFLFITGQPSAAAAGLVPGLYDLLPDQTAPDLLQAGEWRDVTWIARPGVFAASGVQGALLVDPHGSGHLFQGEGGARPSPDGLWVAAWGDLRYNLLSGVRLYQPDGKLLEEVTPDSAQAVAWYPDSQTFFYQSEDQVYQVSFPDTHPVLIGDKALANSLTLVPAGVQP